MKLVQRPLLATFAIGPLLRHSVGSNVNAAQADV